MLTWREELVLQAFEKETALQFCDLPAGVGHKTMRSLIARGLVELVDNTIGEFAKDHRWRRTKKQK